MNPTSTQRNTLGQFCKGSGGRLIHSHSAGGKCTPEYECWVNMKTRCTNPNAKQWKDYGGRGITVCERWLEFENFLADMGLKPTRGHTIERKNNDIGYSPENCRWATRAEQAANKRNARIIEFKGQRKSVAEWAKAIPMREGLIRLRLRRGWDGAKALATPKFFRG